MPKKNQKKRIDIRKVLVEDDPNFDFVNKVKEFLGTEKTTLALDFILSKASKLPFEQFIKIEV